MSLVYWGEVSAAGDLTMAAIVATPGTATQNAVEALISGVAAAIISDDPTIIAAAEDAVADAIATAPQLPVIDDSGEYLRVEVTPAGRVTYATRSDGFVEIPLAAIAGAKTSAEESGEYVRATVTPSGRVMEDAIGADGCVPAWVLDRWKQRMFGAASTGYDVIIVAGQSNAGEPVVLPFTVNETDERVAYWDRATSSIATVPAASTALWAEVGRAYVAAHPNRSVLVVPAQSGSTGFSSTSIDPAPTGYHVRSGGTWDRTLTADTNNLALRMRTDAINAVAAAGAGARVVGFVWAQGEDDTVPNVGAPALTEAQYAAKLDDLIGWVRSQLGVGSLPVVVRSMVPEWIDSESVSRPAVLGVHAAQVDTPRRVVSSAFVFGPWNLAAYDQFRIHYSPSGMREGARLVVDAFYRARMNQTTCPPVAPPTIDVSRSGNQVTVSWEFPGCRVTAFNVEYQVAGGSWETLLLAGPLATSASFTASAASTVAVRASTTNEIGTSEKTQEVHA